MIKYKKRELPNWLKILSSEDCNMEWISKLFGSWKLPEWLTCLHTRLMDNKRHVMPYAFVVSAWLVLLTYELTMYEMVVHGLSVCLFTSWMLRISDFIEDRLDD